MTSFPLSDRTSSIHFVVDMNDCRSVNRVMGSVLGDVVAIKGGKPACNIEDDDCYRRVANIRRYQRAETLLWYPGENQAKCKFERVGGYLAGGIPEL